MATRRKTKMQDPAREIPETEEKMQNPALNTGVDELNDTQQDNRTAALMQERSLQNARAAKPEQHFVSGDYEEEEKPVIGKEEIRNAYQTLLKYKQKKENLDQRIKDDNDWWQLQSREHFKHRTDGRPEAEPKPTSAWLFNSLINKHADIMDNTPEPAINPREESDEKIAKALTAILPVVLDRNDFEETYSQCGWDKLKTGTAVYGVFWNNDLDDGVGDVDVRRVDMMSIYWEPGVDNIQDSRNVFVTAFWDADTFAEVYPQLRNTVSPGDYFGQNQYDEEDQTDNSDKIMVVDWYYKRNYGGKTIVHYCKFAGDQLLYASENPPEGESRDYRLTGYYDHGLYPFVFDVLYPLEKSPAGFGFIDIMISPQTYIDRMDACILKNAEWSSKPRYFRSDDCGVNDDEFANLDNDLVSVAGRIDPEKLAPIQVPALQGNVLNVRQNKIDELKETSGNRDFSQGATSSGVTAASAIAALQEAGSKTSRDFNKGSYRAFTRICQMVIELIRQFYDEPRCFRILGDSNREQYVTFDNTAMKPGMQEESFGEQIAGRKPVFDIKVKAQKSSPFSRLSQNELALKLYGQGIFNPQLADQALGMLDMMDFEGKQRVVERIARNQTLQAQVQWLQSVALQAAQALRSATGDGRILQALTEQLQGMNGTGGIKINTALGMTQTDAMGTPVDQSTQAGKARQESAERATVK